MVQMTCPKCSGTMVAEFVPDRTYGSILVGTWREGAPDKNFLGSVKLRGRPYPITTYRCSACGFLESYAQPQ